MLIDVHKACVLIFNLQREFIPSLERGQETVDSCCWLGDLATHFNVPVLILNHQDLGHPLESLIRVAPRAQSLDVTHFSCMDSQGVRDFLNASGRTQLLLSGAETHISLLQSAFSLEEREGFVIEDASCARRPTDHELACRRLQAKGLPVVSKEMVFFEFLRRSTASDYMALSLKFLDGRYLRE
jgi:isochorismate hydrolase